jgi:hypothetical protein
MKRLAIPQTIAEWNRNGKDDMPGYLGISR